VIWFAALSESPGGNPLAVRVIGAVPATVIWKL